MPSNNISPELCRNVINTYVTPVFVACLTDKPTDPTFGRRDGSLLILNVPSGNVLEHALAHALPDKSFYNDFVVYEHTWGSDPTGVEQVKDGTFTLKALQKAYGTFCMGVDYETVLQNDPEFVDTMELIKFPGAVIRNVSPFMLANGNQELIASYSGLYWWHDSMLASMALDGIKAELNRIQS